MIVTTLPGKIYQLKAIGDDIAVDIMHEGLAEDHAYRTSHVVVTALANTEFFHVGQRVVVSIRVDVK